MLRGDGQDHEIGGVRLCPLGAGRRVRPFRHLKAAPHQKALQAVRTGGRIADEEDARLELVGQRSWPRMEGVKL
jgi:hypothetical protein